MGNTQKDREIDFSWFFNWIQGIGRGGSSGRQRNGGSGNSGGSEAFNYIPGIYTSFSAPYVSSYSGFGGGSGGTGSGSSGSGGSVQGAGFAVHQSQPNISYEENYSGITGLTVTYYKDNRTSGRAVLEITYTSSGNNGAMWKQWCKDTDFRDMHSSVDWDGDNPPYYYTDEDMAKYTNGNSVYFYDWPWRTTPGSYEFTLTLYKPGVGNLLQINWVITKYSNGNYFILPLIVKKP